VYVSANVIGAKSQVVKPKSIKTSTRVAQQVLRNWSSLGSPIPKTLRREPLSLRAGVGGISPPTRTRQRDASGRARNARLHDSFASTHRANDARRSSYRKSARPFHLASAITTFVTRVRRISRFGIAWPKARRRSCRC